MTHVTEELCLPSIPSFNPVALTSMMKTLQQIATAESLLFDRSSGDVRNAINALQLICFRGG